MKRGRKDLLAKGLAVSIVAITVAAAAAAVLLADAGLLYLLGMRGFPFGRLVGYVLLAAVIGLPLELLTHGLTGAIFELGWAGRRLANLFYIPLDTLCSLLAFWAADCLMVQVEANALALWGVSLLSALFSQPIEKGRQRKNRSAEQDDSFGDARK